MPQLDGKVALVTGAANGIGRACAVALAREGAVVCASDVNEAGAAQTAKLITDSGGRAISCLCDVTDPGHAGALVETTVKAFGHLDAAVNNAGISGHFYLRLHEADEDMFERVLDVNLRGVWHCMKAELNQMLSQESGTIVNVASVAGLIGAPKAADYTASKHAVVGLTKSAALDYAKNGIRVNAVCPAYTDTAMVQGVTQGNPVMESIMTRAVPMGRLGQPEEIADAVVWLCSDASSFVTGHALVLDGGLVAM